MMGLMSAVLTGCAVIAVADAAASLAIGAVKTTAKVAGAVVDAAIPDGDDEDKDKE